MLDPTIPLAVIAVLSALLTAAGFVMRWAWHTITRTGRFLDDYFGEEAREGLPARPGVQARLLSLEQKITAVLSETRPNGGNSFRDELRRIGTRVKCYRGARPAAPADGRARARASDGNYAPHVR